MTEYPLITIGITCFNAQDTIEKALESARNQDWPNFEIIIVDDASEDNSVKLIQKTQKQHERIYLYKHNNNCGYPSALNTIIKNAQGEYIAFFDDDDNHQENRLTKQYKRLIDFEKTHPDMPVLCYSHRAIFVDGQEKPEAFVKAIGHKSPEPSGSIVADFLLWNNKAKGYTWGEFGSGTMMASRQVLLNFGFDPDFRRSAEWDLAIRVALGNGYFISVDEPLVRQNKTQTADKAGTKPLDYALMLRKKHKKYLQRKHVYLSSIMQAYSRFYYFRNKLWRSRAYLALACLFSPSKILSSEIAKRTG